MQRVVALHSNDEPNQALPALEHGSVILLPDHSFVLDQNEQQFLVRIL